MTKLDLNLLKVLRVLLEVRNTRRTAEILFTTQSSVSKALGRLRNHFNDELFTREHYGLTPTPKALEVGDKLPLLLDQLDNLVDGQSSFEPNEYSGGITIVINSFIANWLSQHLFEVLSLSVPKAQINLLTWSPNTVEKIIEGEVQVGINFLSAHVTKKIVQRKIGKEEFVFLCNKNHQLKTSTPTFDEINHYSFASLVVPDWNELIPFVEASNLTVKLRSSYFDTLLKAVEETDLLFPVSIRMANQLTNKYRYISIPDIVNVPPTDFAMFVSNNKKNHPMIIWLQQLIKESVKDFSATVNL
jgi:DNA-binding transcriptional LysR family regulator